MKLLDAINLEFPKLGERPVTSLTVKHPTLAILLPIFDQARKNLLLEGWWFNKYPYTVHPDSEGECVIGSDTLSYIPYTDGVAIVRGSKLFNPKTLNYKFTAPVKGEVISDVEFELLPESAAAFVLYSSLVEAYVTDLGVAKDLEIWQRMAGAAWDTLVSEHLRQRKHSTRKSPRWRHYRASLRS